MTTTTKPASKNQRPYKAVSNVRSLGKPKAMRVEPVILPEWPHEDGTPSLWWVRECGAGDHADFSISHQIFDKDNRVIGFRPPGGDDFRFLRHCLWTEKEGGSLVFQTYDEAEAFFRDPNRGRNAVDKLMAAANKVNFGTAATRTLEEAIAEAVGKSEGAETSDLPSNSYL